MCGGVKKGQMGSPASRPQRRGSMSNKDQLRYLYILNSAFCAFMVGWILFTPASWLMGRSKLHDEFLLPYLNPHGIVPPEIITKYEGHTAVHLTHILPGVIWAGIIPFQLHPGFRKSRPILHRRMGYTFFSSSFLMAIGIGVILQRGLLFENSFLDLPHETGPPSEYAVVGLTVYWAATAVYALKCATNRRFASHQRWVIRHVASGIWIAPQRILVVSVYAAIHPPPVAREIQRRAFGEAATIATVGCIALGEYAIYLMDRTTKTKTN